MAPEVIRSHFLFAFIFYLPEIVEILSNGWNEEIANSIIETICKQSW